MSDVVLRATTNYEKPGRALAESDRAFAPPPWPFSEDPRTPECTHDWDGTWGVVGERQYRCKHCRRYVWHHMIEDAEVPAFDPSAPLPPVRGHRGRPRNARDGRR